MIKNQPAGQREIEKIALAINQALAFAEDDMEHEVIHFFCDISDADCDDFGSLLSRIHNEFGDEISADQEEELTREILLRGESIKHDNLVVYLDEDYSEAADAFIAGIKEKSSQDDEKRESAYADAEGEIEVELDCDAEDINFYRASENGLDFLDVWKIGDWSRRLNSDHPDGFAYRDGRLDVIVGVRESTDDIAYSVARW